MTDSADADVVWELYSGLRDELIAVVRSLGDDDAARTVPLTPGWTIRDVVAHVCGLNADVAAGMRTGLGTDERTAHQVEVRAGMSVDEICDEWVGHGEAMRALAHEDGYFGRRLAADLVIHVHDVRHALGLSIDREDAATISGGCTYATHTVDRWLDVTGRRVTIDLGEHGVFRPSTSELADGGDGDDGEELTLVATPYDFLRSVSGRRSVAQVAALDWRGVPGDLLAVFSPYGTLRTVDADV